MPCCIALGATRRDLVVSSIAALGGDGRARRCRQPWSLVVAASTLGPIGIGRRGPWTRGVSDRPARAGGRGAGRDGLVVAAGVCPTMRRAARAPLGVAVSVPGPPSIGAGMLLALRGIRRGAGVPILSAVGAIAVAVAVLVAVASGASTIRDVTAHPIRYGADFDAIVGMFDDSERAAGGIVGERRRSSRRGRRRWDAGHRRCMTEQGELYVQAFVPVDGVDAVRPVITDGREPTRGDEIALGALAMRESGVGIGDRITLRPTAGHGGPVDVHRRRRGDGHRQLRAAGRCGRRARSAQGLARIAPEAIGGVAVRVTDGPGHDGRAGCACARRSSTSTRRWSCRRACRTPSASPGSPSPSARVTALLAAVTLSHALLVCVRRQRRELAVYKSLGFTRRQVVVAVTTEATVLGVVALAIGIPLGVIVARWGWRIIADGLGLAAEASIPLGVVAGSIIGVLVVANLAAAVPGWRAGRIPAAEALRAE